MNNTFKGAQVTANQRVKNICKFFFIGYGWQAFLLRLCVVIISLKLNPLDSATHQFTTGAMKLWLLTCFFLVYTIIKLIGDYTERGKMIQAKMELQYREDEEKQRENNGVK